MLVEDARASLPILQAGRFYLPVQGLTEVAVMMKAPMVGTKGMRPVFLVVNK